MDKMLSSVNYEKQVFDQLDINPYEIVIAVSRSAREINDKVYKFFGSGVEVNPVTVALNRLDKNPDFTYENGARENTGETGE